MWYSYSSLNNLVFRFIAIGLICARQEESEKMRKACFCKATGGWRCVV